MNEQLMTRSEAHSANLTMGDLAEVLFCSSLQPSEAVDSNQVRDAVSRSLRDHHGEVRECAEELAARYGKEPEVASLRMRWARALIAVTFPAAPVAL